LGLGNFDAIRDWGYAPEFCEGMWRILQHEGPDDFVLATGEGHTVREFVESAFRHVGIEIEWSGAGSDEKGFIKNIDRSKLQEKFDNNAQTLVPGDTVVELDASYQRPTEVDSLIGDASKAEKLLDWSAKVRFEELTRIMLDADIKHEKRAPHEN